MSGTSVLHGDAKVVRETGPARIVLTGLVIDPPATSAIVPAGRHEQGS